MLIEPNWGAFSAKFNGKEDKAFEWLCSLLFTKEHKRPIGPLRYFNQAGIEQDPIVVGQEVIGWQAKFVGKLSNQAQALKRAIDDAKRQNPSLTQIYFYLNVDFTSSSKPGVKEPQYKADIDAHSRSKGVALIWRTKSFFETPFVAEENANIARYFFTSERSTIDLIQELSRHTEAILDLIRSQIVSGGAVIKIDRAPLVERLKKTLQKSPFVILSGEAGVGKTAVVKDFYAQLNRAVPMFVFKAMEFNGLTSANQLLRSYGDFTLSDLVQEFGSIEEKYLVIDSAEELSAIERPEVFQEILSTFRLAGWKIVFTTRLVYLEDLERTLIHLYGVSFEPLNVENLTSEELEGYSREYKFALPENERLRRFLQNPFYLNEYLSDGPQGQAKIGYSEFREAMWNTRIAKTSHTKNNLHRKREQCFLEIARKRAVTGSFFVSIEGAEEVLPQLEADEIIKYDASTGGYFVAHDIYAEWALDKIIERVFRSSTSFEKFYEAIGSSLPIRRAFRGWLSEKLISDDQSAKRLIEATVDATAVERHWKDEVIVAALLSPYADVFIAYVSSRLLSSPDKSGGSSSSTADRPASASSSHEDRLLTKILFLLRIACKDVDQEMLRNFGAQSRALSQLFAKPKGSGWNSVIAFICAHKEELGLTYVNLVLPVLDEWNLYNKQGLTTRYAAEIALFYYRELTGEGEHFPYGTSEDAKKQLIRTIFNGSGEIAEKLKPIFDQAAASDEGLRQAPYYELVKAALSDAFDTAIVTQHLPSELLALANRFWFYTPPKDRDEWYSRRQSIEMEGYFDLASNHTEYYPASAFQTPMLGLLRAAPNETVKFILALTNKSVEYFAQTDLGKSEVEEIEIWLTDTTAIKQYICNRIWNLYRGTQVAPVLLESIHMALERWLLGIAKRAEAELAEAWCLYLIKNSRSASITAIVSSVVLAEPSKLFNVAKVLFGTKELFFFDTARMQLDQSAKTTLAICHDPTGLFRDERMRTCDDKHRKGCLEHQALRYQVFRTNDESEELVRARQEAIWKIFDEYYAGLPDKKGETEGDKTWRLYLARMDRRKMNITAEEKDDQVYISFNPDIDPELKQHSDEALARGAKSMQHLSLNLWAHYRFERNESKYNEYPQYENDPKTALAEAKKVLDGLNAKEGDDGSFTLFYHSTPAYVCAVLIRDWFNSLDAAERKFCKDVILRYASMPLSDKYSYQISDGVGAATQVLPRLIKPFPQEAKRIKYILLFGLFNERAIGMAQSFSHHAISAMLETMWNDLPAEANSLFLGYVLLKPRFDAIRDAIVTENRRRRTYQFSEAALRKQFERNSATDLESVFDNTIAFDQLPAALNKATERILVTGFSLLPLQTKNELHKEFVRVVSGSLSKRLLTDDREDRFDYTVRHRFFDKFAEFVLSSEKTEIQAYINPFVKNFGDSREVASLLGAFVSAEDKLHRYEQFWAVWELFYPSVKALCEREDRRLYSPDVVHTYLLAWPYWSKSAKEWRSLKTSERAFFKRASEEIGGHPAVLYSLAKLLNEIGSPFSEDGLTWISGIIERTSELPSRKLEVNTIYYLENLVRGFLLQNRHRVRATPALRSQVLTILNFLLEKGSATAYLLREDILS